MCGVGTLAWANPSAGECGSRCSPFPAPGDDRPRGKRGPARWEDPAKSRKTRELLRRETADA